MNSAPIIARRLLFTALGLGLVAGCDNKPATTTTSPTAEDSSASAKAEPADKANKAEPAKTADDGAKTKVVDGKAPGDDRYALLVEPPTDAAAGKEGEVVVRVVPKEPWHMNLDFPTSIKMDDAPAGVTLANAKLSKADARKLDDTSCEFAVKFTPDEAGEHAFTGKFKFAVCQDEACSPVTEDLSFKVAVK
ncbi:MAG: hypothetical protein AAF799_20850 [Myxococcota bacterium]